MINLNELLGKHKIQPFESYVYAFVLLSQTLEEHGHCMLTHTLPLFWEMWTI